MIVTLLLTLLLCRSDRVKSCDLHPTEQWMLVSLYNGNVHIWNYESQQLVKSFEVRAEDVPIIDFDILDVRQFGLKSVRGNPSNHRRQPPKLSLVYDDEKVKYDSDLFGRFGNNCAGRDGGKR